jgi:spermidine synthase
MGGRGRRMGEYAAGRPDRATAGWGSADVRSGRAELLADADRPQGWLLLLDRIRQSYVDLDDPTYLDFEYARTLADILDALPPGPLTVTHLGGGAFTLARYVAATRPGSTQLVLEPDDSLTAFVRSRLPLPRDSRVRVRAADGRAGVRALRAQSADVVVLDAFVGGRVPADLTTRQAMTEMARILRPDGVLLANLADGPPLQYLRRVLASVRTAFPEALAVADAGVLRGRRFGNICLAAARTPLPEAAVRRAAARAEFPLRVLGRRGLPAFVAGATPLTDLDAIRSPAPPDETWRVGEA